MGKLKRILETLCFSNNSTKFEDKSEIKSTIDNNESDHKSELTDEEDGEDTLASHSKPKENVEKVVLKVSMHCRACAKKVEKHILKIECVTSCKVDLETKKVVVMGDINPSEVLESVSKVKRVEIWDSDDNEE